MTTATKPRSKKGRGTQATAPTPSLLTETLTRIAVDSVVPSPYQPRRTFDEAQLAELSASLQASGLLQPISVRTVSRGDRIVHELIAGERRLRAAQLAGWTEIPAIVRTMDDSEAQALALVENLQRADLSPLEEAQAIKELMRSRKLSQTAVAELLGIPRSTVGDRVGLLEIGPWLELLSAGEITVSQAVELRRYRGAPLGEHQKALREARAEAAHRPDGLAGIDVALFRRTLPRWYQAALYPLFQTEGWAPRRRLFDTDGHDQECDCGRASISHFVGTPARDYCLNPGWWQPRHLAAIVPPPVEGHSDEPDDDTEAEQPAREWSDLGVTLDLPQGAEVEEQEYSDVPAGHVLLVGQSGRWQPGHDGADEWDPADVVPWLAPDEIVAVRVARGGWWILTPAEDAVETARNRWRARWEAREEELRAQAAGAPASQPWVVSGPGTLELLLMACEAGDDDLVDAIRALRGRLQPPPDVVAELRLDDEGEPMVWLGGETTAWVGTLRGAHAEWLATEFLRCWHIRRVGDPVARQVEDEQTAALEEIRRRPVPWVTARPPLLGEQEELLPDPAGDEDEDDGPSVSTCISCGCTDTRACPDGCYWSAIDQEHGVGVCSSCAETLAAAEQMLAAHLAEVPA